MTVRVRSSVGVLVGMLALVGGVPGSSLAVERACAAGQVHVAVVVDFGGVRSTTATCVAAGSRDNGATVLAARAARLGTPAPRFASSGLLCAIDGVPAHGCGETHGGKYAYWSYFNGSHGAWTYANSGPAAHRVDAAVVEGWRWQPDGTGSPGDAPPRAPAEPSAICVPPPVSTPTTSAVHSAGPSHSAPTAAPPGTAAAPTLPSLDGAGTGGPPTVPPAGRRGRAAPRAGPAPSTTSAPPARGADAAAASVHATPGGGHGVPVGLLAGVLLVGALASGGAVVARRRSRTAS